ncbi:MAG: SRPBCC domain-containing protein [Planctomycetota bacterium]
MTRKSAPVRAIGVVALIPVLIGCANIRPVGIEPNLFAAGPPSPTEINWPAQYQPADATFYIRNEIDIAAPPQVIWDVIVEAETWPEWYEGAFDVEVLTSDDGTLGRGGKFSWRTMGLDFISVIHEWEPPHRLGWESRRGDIKGYHAWLVVETENGSRVITDESQFGFLANMQQLFLPNKLRELHDVWLIAIKARAESRVSGGS